MAALGAVARYVLDGWISRTTGGGFPWGTLVINLSGSFLLGVLFALIVERTVASADLRAPVMIGFLGSYTTFSTLMLESWRLAEDGSTLLAVANAAGSLGLGIVAVVGGLALGRAL